MDFLLHKNYNSIFDNTQYKLILSITELQYQIGKYNHFFTFLRIIFYQFYHRQLQLNFDRKILLFPTLLSFSFYGVH